MYLLGIVVGEGRSTPRTCFHREQMWVYVLVSACNWILLPLPAHDTAAIQQLTAVYPAIFIFLNICMRQISSKINKFKPQSVMLYVKPLQLNFRTYNSQTYFTLLVYNNWFWVVIEPNTISEHINGKRFERRVDQSSRNGRLLVSPVNHSASFYLLVTDKISCLHAVSPSWTHAWGMNWRYSCCMNTTCFSLSKN